MNHPRLDPATRFDRVVDALKDSPGVTQSTMKGFGHGGLMVHGKLFAILRGEALLLKLPATQVAMLIVAGEADPFDAGKGRPMKQWALLRADATADWLDLAREAMVFVAG